MLVVDDDPVTLRFFEETIARCGGQVVSACDATTAQALDVPGDFRLALIDQRMPGSSGIAILAALRARGMAAPAIATSADVDTVELPELITAGFAGFLRKPTGMNEITALLARHLGNPASAGPIVETGDPSAGEPVLDDAPALAAIGGDRAALAALRALFRRELEAIVRDFAGVDAIDPTVLRDRLHRLSASCGFCGALALRTCAIRLERRIADHPADTNTPVTELLRVVRMTLEQLTLESVASVA